MQRAVEKRESERRIETELSLYSFLRKCVGEIRPCSRNFRSREFQASFSSCFQGNVPKISRVKNWFALFMPGVGKGAKESREGVSAQHLDSAALDQPEAQDAGPALTTARGVGRGWASS